MRYPQDDLHDIAFWFAVILMWWACHFETMTGLRHD